MLFNGYFVDNNKKKILSVVKTEGLVNNLLEDKLFYELKI